ncbi:hypothetical protein [Paenibacillus ehimensis]|uniref:hypothetical protein n=1 Tax=Paenibacillus ehimensis TaxID=79264 RepID=UPI0013E30FBA|nr:hypothetical protein [Paenibacillus ehimensis]
MAEARLVMELAAPYIGYVLPAVAIISTVAVAESFTGFLFYIVHSAKKRVRL